MIVLDTNVVAEAMKPEANPAVRAWLNEQVVETLYLTSVTLAALLYRIAVLPAGRRRHTLTRALDGLLELFGDRVPRRLLASINAATLVGLRDCSSIGGMIYSLRALTLSSSMG